MANGITSNKYVTLYSSRAHIFFINPETKNSWLAKGERAIPVSFVASMSNDDITNSTGESTSKQELKIIGTGEDGEIVLESTILPKTSFNKRSQKFVQWTDHTDTTYGFGFNSETELIEFFETFQQLQRDMLLPQSHHVQTQQLNHAGAQSNATQSHMASHSDRLAASYIQQQQQQQQHLNNNVSETTNGRFQPTRGSGSSSSVGQANNISQSNNNMQQQFSNTLAHPGHHQQQIKRQQPIQQNMNPTNGNTSLNNGNNDNSLSNTIAGYPRSQSMFGLQSKTAVAGCTNNNNNLLSSGKGTPETENSPMSQSEWQIRDQLKYENERLKQALEESSKNAGVWHSELLNLRTNNVKLTQALQESKAHVEEWERELFGLRDENKELKLRVMAIESANDPEKDYKKDLQKYKNYVEEVQSELRRKETEIDELQRSMEELELKASSAQPQNGQLDDSNSSHPPISTQQKQKLNIINVKLEAKISELAGIQKEFSQIVDKIYHS